MDELRDDQLQMRGYIEITEALLCAYARATRPEAMMMITESVVQESVESFEHPVLSDARDLVFKLRSFMEDSAGEYALGVENGMQRAADMIENLIRRHEKGSES